MALVKCRGCGMKIHDGSASCVHCGKRRIPKRQKIFLVLILTLFVFYLAVLAVSTLTSAPIVLSINGDGETTTDTNLLGIKTAIYVWEGDGELGANANVTFQNDKLIGRARAEFSAG